MPNERTPRTMQEAFGLYANRAIAPCTGSCNAGRACDCTADIDYFDPPREPLSPAEAMLLVVVWIVCSIAVAGFIGWAWTSWPWF
jgi:hypothetical protein